MTVLLVLMWRKIDYLSLLITIFVINFFFFEQIRCKVRKEKLFYKCLSWYKIFHFYKTSDTWSNSKAKPADILTLLHLQNQNEYVCMSWNTAQELHFWIKLLLWLKQIPQCSDALKLSKGKSIFKVN